jgi:hypothetical protein
LHIWRNGARRGKEIPISLSRSETPVKRAATAPLDTAARHHDAEDMLTEVLVKGRPLWRHQLGAKSIADHGEAT